MYYWMIFLPFIDNHFLIFPPQFIREYTGKVDELIKDKIEAQKVEKAKEKEEKDVIAQQVHYPPPPISNAFHYEVR